MWTMIIAYMADRIFGDPYWLPHPIRFIGSAIKKTESFLRKYATNAVQEKNMGMLLTFIIVGSTYLITFLLIQGGKWIHPYIGYGIAAFLTFQILAAKSLDMESRKVFYQLEKKNIVEARRYLSYIVGRDTNTLDEKEIIRGTVETVAESTSDGIIAPLFYICLGGAPLGMAYKAINTLDSMVGYKNEQYMHFGWASAKLDDLANYVPARLTALFMVIAAFVKKYDWKNSIRIIQRDRRNHKSPNCGYPESAAAGALSIQIGGTNTYFGQKVYKPTIGEPLKPLEKEDIDRAIQLMYRTSMIGLIFFIGAKFFI
ncbi:adenosylcobinamide-phosphate synthase CbiB [Clostridiaceae bacterium 35-E11]